MFITFCLNFNVMNTTMSTQKIYITSSAVKFKFKAINRIRRFCNKGILFLITFIVFCFVFTFFFASNPIVMDISVECKLFLENQKKYFLLSCMCWNWLFLHMLKLIIYQLLWFYQVNDRMTTHRKKHLISFVSCQLLPQSLGV